MEEEEVEEVLRASGARERVRDTLPPSSSSSRSRSRSRSRSGDSDGAPQPEQLSDLLACTTQSAKRTLLHLRAFPRPMRRTGEPTPTPTCQRKRRSV